MKQKTAMAQLKEKLQIVVNDLAGYIPSTFESNYRIAMQNVINDIDAQMLQLEKEQIYEAFVAGDQRGTGEIPFNCEQYYQQTYKP